MAFSVSLSLLLLSFGGAILFFKCVFYLVTGRPYRKFPSFRLDAHWLVSILTGQYPKNASSTKVFLIKLLKYSAKFYQHELCILWMLRPYLLVYDENVMKILGKDIAVDKSSVYDDVFKDVLGNGLLGSTGKLWKDHRKLLNPAFNLSILKGYMNIINQNAKILVNEFQSTEGKPTTAMLSILKRCAFEILVASIFDLNGKNINLESKTEDLLKLIDELLELMVYRIPRPWLNWRFVSPFHPAEKKYKKCVKKCRILVEEIIDDLIKSYAASETQEYSDDETEVRRTLSQVLVKQHLEDPTFTKDILRDHFQSFLAAGYDTVAHSLMWCLYVLGQHPEAQKEAWNEIEAVVIAKNVTYDNLGELKYLDCVIKESLRLYSPVPIYGRKINEEISFGKYTIPKDTEVAFSPFLLHRNPNIYHEPKKFKPERFYDSSTVRSWMYIPFGLGHRDCIGKKFAMMEMKVLLVYILREFQIKSLDTVADEDLDWDIMLKTTKPICMLFETRHPNSK